MAGLPQGFIETPEVKRADIAPPSCLFFQGKLLTHEIFLSLKPILGGNIEAASLTLE